MKSKTKIRAVSMLLALSLGFGSGIVGFSANAADTASDGIFVLGYPKDNGYSNYQATRADLPIPDASIRVSGDAFTSQVDAEAGPLADFKGKSGCLEWNSQKGSVTYTVTVPKHGLYRIALGYYPNESRSSNIELSLQINGETPFEEAKDMAFERQWTNATTIDQDNRGNDLRPMQVTIPSWLENDCRDKDGLVSSPFLFELQEGANTLTFSSIREGFVLGYIQIYNEAVPDSYTAYRKKYPDVNNGQQYEEYLQGESAVRKSDSSLYPITDRTSSATYPYHYSKIRLNTIGGSNWSYPGQWLEWEFTVPQDGWYTISMRERQDLLRGLLSHRRIYIDGSVPFEELDSVPFSYNSKWRVTTLGDGEQAYQFYFTSGETHTIRMEAPV